MTAWWSDRKLSLLRTGGSCCFVVALLQAECFRIHNLDSLSGAVNEPMAVKLNYRNYFYVAVVELAAGSQSSCSRLEWRG
jgi:hypothetical protein